MWKIRLIVLGTLGIISLLGCKRQPDGKQVLPENFSGTPERVNISLWKDLPFPDSASGAGLPDTETERGLRAAGLVEVSEVDSSIEVCLMYSTPENFTGRVLYTDLHKAFLLPEAARRVADAQCRLKAIKPDWSLIIYDAARPMSVQQSMWDKVKHTDKQVYVSNPARGGGLHNYGVAVDISLIDSLGQTVDMGSPVDYFGEESRPDREELLLLQGRIALSALENRRLLRQVMREAGFRPLHSEWWHFHLMSREDAKKRLKAIF